MLKGFVGFLRNSLQPSRLSFVPTMISNASGNSGDQDSRSSSNPHSTLKKYLLLSSLGYYTTLKDEEVKCFFNSFAKNDVKHRAHLNQYPANKPVEDRWAIGNLVNTEGFVAAVFDGHGGWQVAEFVSKSLIPTIDFELSQIKSSPGKTVEEALSEAFRKVEQKFTEFAKEGYLMGFETMSKVGACALVAVVMNDDLFVANLGDSQGVLLSPSAPVKVTKLNKKLNANSKKVQAALKAQFPKDDKIFVCKRAKVCYVKGRLQPTHSFGDLGLKDPFFNNPTVNPRLKIENFAGPYISITPEIRKFKITKETEGFLLATDGLWDQLKAPDVLDVFEKSGRKGDRFIKLLNEAALKHAAEEKGMTYQELLKLEQGNRRSTHDDITMVYINLKNQVG